MKHYFYLIQSLTYGGGACIQRIEANNKQHAEEQLHDHYGTSYRAEDTGGIEYSADWYFLNSNKCEIKGRLAAKELAAANYGHANA